MNEDRPHPKTVFRHSFARGVRSKRLPQLLKQAQTPPPVPVPVSTPAPAPPKKHIPPAPSRIPATDKDLVRAILLLGHWTKTELLKGAKDELTALIGGYPQPETAAVWKATLKQIRKQKPSPAPGSLHSVLRRLSAGQVLEVPEQPLVEFRLVRRSPDTGQRKSVRTGFL